MNKADKMKKTRQIQIHFQLVIITLILYSLEECSANLPPVFTMDMNNLAISENTNIGTVIYKLEGSDPENSTLHFNLRGTDALKVNHNTGLVTVVKPLDYETNDTLNVIVSISDEVQGGRNNIVEVPITVIVLDENDNAPDFQNAPYNISAEEDVPIGTTIFSEILVRDKDSNGNSIEVECVNLPEYQNSCSFFDIQTIDSQQNIYQGSVVLKAKLNYTIQENHQFLLKATDGELDTITNVTVNVGDVQDTPPRFISDLYAEIEESASINTLVMVIRAEDGDKGVPRTIAYDLVSNPMDYFILDGVTGELRTAKPLDKEAVDNPEGIITLVITATELVNGVKTQDSLTVTKTEVTVKIKDVNDEPPSFNQREYFIQIPENIPEGSPLPDLNMIVTDPDEGNNSAFSLQLNDISGVFSIEPKMGKGSSFVEILVANNSLDYEDLNQRKFIILAVAKELYTKELLSSTATVTVTVTDINDNAPTFDQEGYSASISELSLSGSSIITITAKDRDSGKFGENGIFYHLSGSGSEKFNVDKITGTVSVAECDGLIGKAPCLDYEEKSEYQLQFIATDDDGKGQTTIVPLNINLLDSNDNSPIFSQSIYKVFVNEGAVKFDSDVIVEARDADKTSHLTYSIISGNEENLFGIEKNQGKIRILNNRGLDVNNESNNIIILTVMASDGKFSSTTTVNITIRDINNNSPKFTQENYKVSIPETEKIGSSVIQLEATDLDSGTNAELEYHIQKGSYEDFEIDNNSGIVSVSSKLDYDRRNTYNIEVVAIDHGEQMLTGTTTLTLNIINTNNKLPYFIPVNQTATVMEDAEIGTEIHSLVALDPDVTSSAALNYAATEPITAFDKHGNQVLNTETFKNFFLVDTNTGKVTVLNNLQRDIAAIIQITVLVTDITAPTIQQGKGLLTVTISHVNDAPPEFLPPWTVENPSYYLELKEEQPIGTIVATYKAFDNDSDIASYAIIPKNDFFEINNGTGIVQIKKIIDYEETKSINFTVVAFDRGVPQLNSSALVNVQVVNLNDNDPVFSSKIYNASVDENSANGTFITSVKAKDFDEDEYGRVTYSLFGEDSKHFNIEPETGIVSVANSNFLDYETRNASVIQVVATDTAPNHLKRSATVPLNIKIIDVNDNVPKFNQSEYNVSVIENIRLNPPMPLLQVNASDKDSGIFGTIHYSIVTGNENDIFILGLETGILYPHKSLSKEHKKFRLMIEARDGAGNGQLFDRAFINVQVLNVNNHKPVFITPALLNSTIEITQNAVEEDSLVIKVKATDQDENESGRITYHFQVDGENLQETNEFSINQETGELKLIFLNLEEQTKFQLVLVARDHGYPKWFETLAYLTIQVIGKYDNKPEFPESNPYHFFLTENEPKGVRIGQVKALYRNEMNQAKVYYYLLPENNQFYLDKSDGSLYANKSFDREEQDEYNLLIVANSDPDFSAIQNTTDEEEQDRSIVKVKVTINDLNDNEPVFERSVYNTAVNAMANINDFVLNVTAFDRDLGLNGSLTYYIKASNLYKYGSNKSSGSIIPSPFNISERGEIFTATYLAENNQHRFIIDIIAREDAFPEREAKAQVHVWIFEPEQLIRVILSRPSEEVTREKDEIIGELGNSTQDLVIVDEIRYHTDDSGNKNEEWSDMYILVVDPITRTIRSVPEVLKKIDSKYDVLKDYYVGFAIENVVPAFVIEKGDSFDLALAALIALLIVLFVGIITFIVVCCCLKHWVISPSDLKKKDALIQKAIIDDLNTTENPLWIEQKLKIYEEQELTMQVFNEPDQINVLERRDSDDFVTDDNTYATIQNPHRRRSSHVAAISLNDDLADYATLSGPLHQIDSPPNSMRGVPNYYEAAMGFQGSTFQVPGKILNNSIDCDLDAKIQKM